MIKFSKISKFSLSLKITTLELDQYEVLGFMEQSTTINIELGFASYNIVVLCSIKPHIDQVQV
jgi:hypothetical protein